MSSKIQIKTPETEKEKKFVVSSVISFYKERPQEVRTISFDKMRDSIWKLLDESGNHEYFLILSDGDFSGVVQIMLTNNDIAEIILIYVVPKYRGEGLAKKGLKRVLAKLEEREDVSKIKTEIGVDNDISQNLFEELGFEKHSLIYFKD